MTGAGDGVTSRDVEIYGRAIRALVPLTEASLAEGLRLARARTMPKGALFLRPGARATEVAVVTDGWLREFFPFPDGTERTKAFVFEGEGTGSLADLLEEEPSRAGIVAEEEARLLCWPYLAYRELCARSDDWGRLHLAVTERLVRAKARREYELLGLDAEERYRALLQRAPWIEQRVSGRHIASYLGITPVHLSRLRRRRARTPVRPRSGS
jgi:CRP-like cAMP-binding protein